MSYQASKPAIVIYGLASLADQVLKQLQLGIEEEGLPFMYEPVVASPAKDVIAQAYGAAQASPLLVGLAGDGTELVLHYRHLAQEQFVYRLKGSALEDLGAVRLLGSNAAKLVKGIPLRPHPSLEVSF